MFTIFVFTLFLLISLTLLLLLWYFGLWGVFFFLIVKHGAIIYDTIPLHKRIVKRESEEKERDGTTC